MSHLCHSFFHVLKVFEVQVQLLMAIPAPNSDDNPNSITPKFALSPITHVLVLPLTSLSATQLEVKRTV